MKINRKTFYAEIKSIFRGGYDGRVGRGRLQGLDIIMDEWETRDDIEKDELAYVIATAIHETAYTLQPVTEYGGKAYLQSKKYWPYIGRGYVQLTWDYNYKRAGEKLGIDLLNHPELALDPKNAVKILFDGMIEGWFTGKKLSDFIDNKVESDIEDEREYEGGRRIINGTDKAKQIAAIALKVDRALYKSWVTNDQPILSSRTVQGAGVAGLVSAKELNDQVQGVVSAVEAHQDAFTSGQVVGIIIGVVAV